MDNKRKRITLDLTPEAYGILDRLAQGATKADVLRRALALVEMQIEARNVGQRMAIVDAAGKVVTLVVTV